ncbi:sugar ABC transporter ATP-binding protein [Bythopirellula goksoeyrii]|uniref:Ribose import ATP-binding protein RbsA n=1 Tax=Bythopirellula goksoeyrii TaxID=1400387 RepID=A0A5B9Q9Q5_9BACT|nr:sugar ABC transporter ATP-binding protein [Bythopirellula goksoeyrii]QEG34162.1 Ribose import ATP-binding protein RbsA [Bythopirellula goksoeyrii]
MSAASPSAVPVLSGRGIVKRYPGVLALDHVDFEIHAEEVHGLIGENGAGKTTLMHILAGAQQPSEGKIELDGQPVRFANASEALQQRICIVYQELNLIPHLSVAENVFLGREILTATGLIDAKSQYLRCEKLLAPLDPSIDPRSSVNALRVGQQQIVEIAKALNSEARVIFMDEPTSAISDSEVEVLFKLIDSLRKDGIAIVYVSHKLDELLRITDRITVLRDGKYVDTVTTCDAQQETIVRLMVGRDLSEMYTQHAAESGEEVLRVDSISQQSGIGERLRVDGVSFSVAAGEVLGIFGLMGAGRTELLESIYGLHPNTTSGTVSIHGQRCDLRSPAAAMRHGIGLVPEDRKRQGLVLGMSVENNLSLSNIGLIESYAFLNQRLEQRLAENYVEQLSIKTPSVRQKVSVLSGGNQQKVVLGRVLSMAPRVLLLDEPTRGIDINAKREIYALVDQLKHQGLAIVVVSSELPELLGISDRIMVMCEGRKTAEFHREQATEEVVMQAAVPGFQIEAAAHA